MSDGDRIIDWIISIDKSAVARYLSLIIATGATMWIGAILVEQMYGVEWFPALNATGSVALTVILATLYFRQSKVLESQQDLLAAELNRGVREKHTKILRERVQEWHGNIDLNATETDPWDAPSDNLPSVGRASFESATENYFLTSEENFAVIPRELEDDRFFDDLLENHAPELREKADSIEKLQAEFSKVRSEFEEEFDYAKTIERDQYRLEPTDYVAEWVFEQLVRVEREPLKIAEVRERMLSKIDNTGQHPEEPAIWVRMSTSNATRGVYLADFDSDQDVPAREDWEEIRDEVEELFDSMLDEIESDRPFDEIQSAAELLNEGQDAIEDLRYSLVEYDGRLVYPGDCKYLREAEIRPGEEL